MHDSKFFWGNPVKRSVNIVAVVAAVIVCVAMAVLLVFVADLNTEIQHANHRADAEWHCAKAIEAWVHQQVAPSDATSLESLTQVKNSACKAQS